MLPVGSGENKPLVLWPPLQSVPAHGNFYHIDIL
jgi:hypothetical protein